MGIIQIKKSNISDQVYTQLKSQILNRAWKPGEKIPSENQLIELLGVSRGTVRQAIQRLAGEGLLYTKQGEGSFVQPGGLDTYFQTAAPIFTIGEQEISKIFEFREMFESGVAEVAAEKITPEQLELLGENYRRMQQEVHDTNRYVETDLEFHRILCNCTGNTLAIQIFNSYEELLRPAIQTMTSVIGVGNGMKYHLLILEAVRKHDGGLSRALMQEHLCQNMALYHQLKHGPPFMDS